MSIHNICFHREIRKMSIFFVEKSALLGVIFFARLNIGAVTKTTQTLL